MTGRGFLIHWNAAEADAYAADLRADGWEVSGTESVDGERAYRRVKGNPPDVLVVYLTRLPSHGRETVHAIRSLKATRALPVVFVGGNEEAGAKVQAKVPDAVYVGPEALKTTLAQFAKG